MPNYLARGLTTQPSLLQSRRGRCARRTGAPTRTARRQRRPAGTQPRVRAMHELIGEARERTRHHRR
jgi:hypothetical protein